MRLLPIGSICYSSQWWLKNILSAFSNWTLSGPKASRIPPERLLLGISVLSPGSLFSLFAFSSLPVPTFTLFFFHFLLLSLSVLILSASASPFSVTLSLYSFSLLFLIFSFYFSLFHAKISFLIFPLPYPIFRKGNGNPLQYSCLENSMDRGAW